MQKVLVTGVGSTTGQSVIKGLRRQDWYDVTVVGTDINEQSEISGAAFCDEFFDVPPASDAEAYVCRLEALVAEQDIDLLIPIVDAELDVLAQHRAGIENRCELLLSSANSVDRVNDKLRCDEFFREIDVPTVATTAVDDEDELRAFASEVGYPLVVKPRRGVSSRGVYEIRNEDELPLVRRVEDAIAQEKATGQEYTIDVFRDGEDVLACVPRKRLETRSGISYKGETVADEELIEYARRIADELDLYGPANVQCFKAKDGTVRFFEVNPRFSGSLPLTIAAGVNTPAMALRLVNGTSIDIPTTFKPTRMCRYWAEVFHDV